ncbi:MAG: IreB family regulatory phosphoprotein [Bacilli bacterium]|nr:IreB family regulatory phosphoprotein [Bacilli bacterium]MDD4733786.1 IreB family regulatory phosphoprotein [Bacilli bacterium]
MDKTKEFSSEEIQEKLVEETLKEVIQILDERGYNPINQIVGYLLSGDPGYISSHNEARAKLTKFERSKILEVMVKSYIE